MRSNHRGAVRRLKGATSAALGGAGRLVMLAIGTARASRSGAADAATRLQVLPDSTLRGLAATSVGLGTGFYLAGRPRLVVAAGIAPAVLAGVAILLRPVGPPIQAEQAG